MRQNSLFGLLQSGDRLLSAHSGEVGQELRNRGQNKAIEDVPPQEKTYQSKGGQNKANEDEIPQEKTKRRKRGRNSAGEDVPKQ